LYPNIIKEIAISLIITPLEGMFLLHQTSWSVIVFMHFLFYETDSLRRHDAAGMIEGLIMDCQNFNDNVAS